MSGFVAVFAREFRLRRVLLLGALLIGLAAPILPRLEGLSGTAAAESGTAAALLLGLLTCVVYSFVLGSGAISLDLTGGRLGFDFVRPISGFSIWAGRIGAAVALLTGSALLLLAPAVLSDPTNRILPERASSWLPALDNPAGAFVVGLFGCLVLLFLTHAVAVLWAARSAALGLDLAGLLGVGLLLGAAFSRLLRNLAMDALGLCLILFVGLLFTALVGASLAQLLVGRTDLERGHRALSLALWTPLLAGSLALEAASRWVVSPRLRDLAVVDFVSQPRSGTWFGISGDLRGRGRLGGQFLIDSATGRVVPQGVGSSAWTGPTSFSKDGKTAAWLPGSPSERAIRWVDLSAEKPESKAAPISLDGSARWPALSATGEWLAIQVAGRILVFELRTGRLLESVPLTAGQDDLRMIWTPDDRLRLWTTDREGVATAPRKISIAETQIPGGALESSGSIELVGRGFNWDVDLDGSVVLVREEETGRHLLFDGRTGGALGAIDSPRRSRGVLLADGTAAVLVYGPGPPSLSTYDRTLGLRRRFDLQGYRAPLIAGQPTSDTILVSGLSERAENREGGRRLLLLDQSTGTLREVGPSRMPSWGASGSAGRVLQTGPATFARWDPATETLKPIVPR